MKQCSQCGIKTKYLSFMNGGYCYIGKNYGKAICGDCDRKLKEGKPVKWRGVPSKETLKLIKIINGLGYRVKPRLERIYAGHWQRSSGAWSWNMELVGIAGTIGSQYPVREILKAKKVYINTSSGNLELEISDK